MTSFNRRTFLRASSLAVTAVGILPTLSSAQILEDILAEQDLRMLTAGALEAAKAAGAVYADTHVKYIKSEQWSTFKELEYPNPLLATTIGFSVRALINGYWGFAASDGIVTKEDAVKLGHEAAVQAKMSFKRKPGIVDLTQLPSVANGSWVMPVEIDPFTVSYEEKVEVFTGIRDFLQRQRYGVKAARDGFRFIKEERTFASTDGAFTRQTIYNTTGSLSISVTPDWRDEGEGMFVNFPGVAGAGWEYIRNAPFQDRAESMIEEALRVRRKKPIDIGRYDIVFDANALAAIIGATVGPATQLDRAMGYESDNIGSSYLTEPEVMLDTFEVGSPLLNIVADRSMPNGAATAKWDEEGIEPVKTTLIKNGILNDFQTTRESASWIAEYYDKKGVPVRSNGCAGMYTSTSPVTQVSPNLTMTPGTAEVSFEDMIKDTKKGIAVKGGYTYADQQALNGTGQSDIVYEIINGKLGSAIKDAVYMYRAPDFWKNLVAIGGKSTVYQRGEWERRTLGNVGYTIAAVPGKVTGVIVTDMKRKV